MSVVYICSQHIVLRLILPRKVKVSTVAIKQGVDAMTQTIGQMSEAESNSYEARAENFEAF